jgi:lipoprotein-releasing system permease protein
MFHPLSLYVGLRYVRARTHKFFVSFITWASLAGVSVGVAALIVILSVMNGFEGELRQRLLSLSAHARLSATDDVAPSAADRLIETVRGAPGVEMVAPYAEAQVLAVRTPEMLPVLLRGIDPESESTSDAARVVVQGTLADLVPGSDRVILGAVVSQRLAAGVGDTITLLVPSISADGTPTPRLREFEVAGIFEVGLQDHDGTLVLAHLEDVRALASLTALDAGLELRFDDALGAAELTPRLRALLPRGFEVRDWTQEHANYFRAIRIEKMMMALILMLVVAVAAFNIVAMLVMVVTDKRTDIAILRTFGAAPRKVMGVFLTQGLVIGWLGVASGVALGLLVAYYATPIARAIEWLFGFQMFDSDVYYISSIPSDVQWPQVAWIGGTALVLTALATVYPSLRAARTPPAEALRYE